MQVVRAVPTYHCLFRMTNQLPFHFAKRHQVFVASYDDANAQLHYSGHLRADTILECQRFLGRPVNFLCLEEEAFEVAMAAAFESDATAAVEAMTGIEEEMELSDLVNQLPRAEDLLESEDDAPVVRLLNAILTQGVKQGASDIHFEVFEKKFVVRFRIDGVMREVLQPPRVLTPLILSRLKVMAKLNIAERRLPQDGRIALKIAGRPVDVRVSTIPTQFGERIVLRILDRQSAALDLKKLGMSEPSLVLTRRLIDEPHGIILVTGPTGSGKTTTLYAGLTELNDVSRNILTVEDPIEYYLPGIGQTQVNPKVEMTFARGLRAILRQDPDVVMVGEIRDLETAKMSVQASLTGHLVLSTLHTNTAIGAVTRLRDMGVEPFLLSSTLVGVIAQRLVRVLCAACKEAKKATQKECKLMGLGSAVDIFHAVGCVACNQTGYSGRTGLYEIIDVDEQLAEMIHDNESEAVMEAHVRPTHPTMREDGWRRVLAGDTSIDEVLHVTTELLHVELAEGQDGGI